MNEQASGLRVVQVRAETGCGGSAGTPSLQVLRIITRLNGGGPARHVLILDDGLQRLGFRTLLAYGETASDEATLESLVERIGIPATRLASLSRPINLFGDLRAFTALVRLMFTLRPDVVHTHTAKAGALGRLAARVFNLVQPRHRRCLVVHTFHGHVLEGYFGRLGTLLAQLLERWLAGMADCTLVLSPRQRDDIVGRYRIARPERTRIVPLGLDLAPLLRLPAREGGVHDDVVFAFVGRFVPVKNLPLLLDAFSAVHRRLPRTRLLMAGDGELRPFLERQVAARGLHAAVELTGWQDDLADVYRRIDVLVLTSWNEGTPLAALEAMAAARPVIATLVGGVPDIVADGETGLLVPPGAVDALTDAMMRLARDAAERRRLGLAARDAVGTRFSVERLVGDIARLYEAELARRRRGYAVPDRGTGGRAAGRAPRRTDGGAAAGQDRDVVRG